MLGINMHLTRCRDQKLETLDEFYTELGENVENGEIGKIMLSLLARLRALPDDRRMWGLTSHLHLCLLAKDSSMSPWFVRFIGLDSRNYFVEYLMPERVAPWPRAYVQGEARSEDEAVQMILSAIEKSEGWSER